MYTCECLQGKMRDVAESVGGQNATQLSMCANMKHAHLKATSRTYDCHTVLSLSFVHLIQALPAVIQPSTAVVPPKAFHD